MVGDKIGGALYGEYARIYEQWILYCDAVSFYPAQLCADCGSDCLDYRWHSVCSHSVCGVEETYPDTEAPAGHLIGR